MEKLIIIGSGPSGLTAAIYTARANLKPLVLEGSQPGGQLTTTTVVENWPGAPEGVSGPQLVMDMRQQAEKFGAVPKFETVESVDFNQQPFKVKTNVAEYETEAVIIATGARSRRLNLPREDELIGKGLHTCATCDAAFYRDKEVIVIGGGDSAMEEATFIAKFASKVYIVHRRAELNASLPMQERAKNNPKIEFIWNSEIVEYVGQDKLEAVKIKNIENGEITENKIDGLFFAIGHIPNTEAFVGQLKLGKGNFIEPVNNVFTEIEGVFVAGDVADWRYRQAITASGLGCMAALEAEKYLAAKE